MSDNKYMRPSGIPKQMEQRRRKDITLLEQGHKAQEVARLGASPGTLCDWKKAYQGFGEAFFEAHSPPERKPGLSDRQIAGSMSSGSRPMHLN